MELQSPDKDRHLDGISDLFAKSFGDYWRWVDDGNDGYLVGAPYDWAASRVGIVDGVLATHFGVWDFTMRIGTGTVRVAGIGAVATHRARRSHGLMSQTAADAVSSLRSAGYDMSLLFGIANYYTRFGYVGTFPEHKVSIATRDLNPADSPVRFEPFDGDYVNFAAQYNQENDGVTGTFVRPTFTTNRRPKRFSAYTFDGGYLVAGRYNDELQVADCAGAPEDVVEVARQLAVREVTGKITFVFVPDKSRMGEYLQTIPHTRTAGFTPNGGPMVKVVNLQSTMEKISLELSLRLGGGALPDYSGKLIVHGDGESVALVIEHGTVAAVEPAQPTASGSVTAGAPVARLVIGDGDPVRICRQSGIKLEGDARYLVPILFPDQEPSTILWDRF
jgi:predicted N-acetyltransferase YhbS